MKPEDNPSHPTYHELITSWGIGEGEINYICNISRRFKISYIETPQVACNPILRSLWSAEVFPEKPDLSIVHSRHLSPLGSINEDNFSSALFGEQYFKFCFVRDPLDRVLSAYLSKVVGNVDPGNKQRLQNMYLHPDSEVSFLEFMRRIAELPPHVLDVHWRPQHLLLNFGQIGYNHIGRFERFGEDFQLVLNMIHKRSGIESVQDKTAHKINTQLEVKPYLTPEVVDIVNEVYSLDYEYLGYRRPQSAGATKKTKGKDLSYKAGVSQTLERYLMFVGYNRSGSSLIGVLLNSHPEMLVSDEVGVMDSRHFSPQTTQYEVLRMIFSGDMEMLEYENKPKTYAKDKIGSVKDQWKNRYSRLRVIGDKTAYLSTEMLYNDPSLLDSFQKMIGFPISVLFIYRNPYDIIATLGLRDFLFNFPTRWKLRWSLLSAYKPADSEKYELDSEYVSKFFEHSDKVREVLAMFSDDQVFSVSHEDFVASPMKKLQEICTFLNVKCTKDYLDSCTSVVNTNAHKSRYKVRWTREQLDEVGVGIEKYPWLKGYTFYE